MRQRTPQQNRAMHLYFGMLARQLNSLGLDMRTVLKESVELWWSKYMVRKYLTKPLLAQQGRDKLNQQGKVVAYRALVEFCEELGILEPFPPVSSAFNFADFEQMVAERLNEAGFEMRKILPNNIKLDWTTEYVKDYLWRPIQMLALGKDSTTDLATKEIDQVYEILNRHLSEKFGKRGFESVRFPSYEDLIVRNYAENKNI